MLVNDKPPLTATGTRLWLADGVPRYPSPQQYAAPVVVRPHATLAPAETFANDKPPETGLGSRTS
jgi:hypothetical protein